MHLSSQVAWSHFESIHAHYQFGLWIEKAPRHCSYHFCLALISHWVVSPLKQTQWTQQTITGEMLCRKHCLMWRVKWSVMSEERRTVFTYTWAQCLVAAVLQLCCSHILVRRAGLAADTSTASIQLSSGCFNITETLTGVREVTTKNIGTIMNHGISQYNTHNSLRPGMFFSIRCNHNYNHMLFHECSYKH